jgi:hypothetical protein
MCVANMDPVYKSCSAFRCVCDKGASVYLWRDTGERDVAEKIQHELYEIFNFSNIFNHIKFKRLAWEGTWCLWATNEPLRRCSELNQMAQELLEDGNCEGGWCCSRHENIRARKPPSTETNGQNFLREPGPTESCRANDDDDDEHA